MEREDPLYDFTVENRKPTEKETQMMREFILKSKKTQTKIGIHKRPSKKKEKAKIA